MNHVDTRIMSQQENVVQEKKQKTKRRTKPDKVQ